MFIVYVYRIPYYRVLLIMINEIREKLFLENIYTNLNLKCHYTF